jgi:GT2 family glycosyltransferase
MAHVDMDMDTRSDNISPTDPTELMPFLSVVIPVGRMDPSFFCCLQALSRQILPCEFFEIILVLDGVALSREILETLHPMPAITVCATETRRGRSFVRNRGLERARGTVVVSLDSDMIASPDLLSNYFDAHQRGAVACVGVRKFVYPYETMDVSSAEGFGTMLSACFPREDYRDSFYRATDFMRRAAEPFWAFSTCNCSYPIDLAKQVGLFDEQMTGWGLEDQEFGYRLWKTGQLTFTHVPAALAIHIEHSRDRTAEMQMSSINRAYCVRKHGAVFADPRGRRVSPLVLR